MCCHVYYSAICVTSDSYGIVCISTITTGWLVAPWKIHDQVKQIVQVKQIMKFCSWFDLYQFGWFLSVT
jgi:hypothetical protein